MKRCFLPTSMVLVGLLFNTSVGAQPAPATPSPAPDEFHHEGTVFLDVSPTAIGLETGQSWGRRTQVGVWAGAYFPLTRRLVDYQPAIVPEAYVSVARTFGRVYVAGFFGAGARFPDPGLVGLRSFFVATTTHRFSVFAAFSLFCTPREFYPGTLRENNWFVSTRFGPTAMIVPGLLKLQAFVELPIVPGVPVEPNAGFIFLLFH